MKNASKIIEEYEKAKKSIENDASLTPGEKRTQSAFSALITLSALEKVEESTEPCKQTDISEICRFWQERLREHYFCSTTEKLCVVMSCVANIGTLIYNRIDKLENGKGDSK